ncbi:MAG: hypothetical protein WCI17_08675 [bacterium]
MSMIIHPRRSRNENRNIPHDAGGRVWVWLGVMGAVIGLLIAWDRWHPARASGRIPLASQTAPAAFSVSPGEPAPDPVTQEQALPDEQQRLARRESARRSLQDQEFVIRDGQVDRMRTEASRSEALPPEARRVLAPSAATIRVMQEERVILQ